LLNEQQRTSDSSGTSVSDATMLTSNVQQPAAGPESHPAKVMLRAVAGVRLDGQVRHLPASRKL